MVTSGGLVSGRWAFTVHQSFELLVPVELTDGLHFLQVAAPRPRQERLGRLGRDVYANIDTAARVFTEILREAALAGCWW